MTKIRRNLIQRQDTRSLETNMIQCSGRLNRHINRERSIVASGVAFTTEAFHATPTSGINTGARSIASSIQLFDNIQVRGTLQGRRM